MQQPLSEMSYTHRNSFGFVPPHSFGSTQAYTNKKCYNYVEKGHLPHQCPLALNYHRNPTLAESSKMMLEDESAMSPPWKLATLEEMYPKDNMP
jgi:hypothetical protein